MSVDGLTSCGDQQPHDPARAVMAPGHAVALVHILQTATRASYRSTSAAKALRKISSVAGFKPRGKWSPDGQKIALSIERGGNSDIYLLDPSGAMQRQLTKGPEIDVSPTWSPDGQRSRGSRHEQAIRRST